MPYLLFHLPKGRTRPKGREQPSVSQTITRWEKQNSNLGLLTTSQCSVLTASVQHKNVLCIKPQPGSRKLWPCLRCNSLLWDDYISGQGLINEKPYKAQKHHWLLNSRGNYEKCLLPDCLLVRGKQQDWLSRQSRSDLDCRTLPLWRGGCWVSERDALGRMYHHVC